jgi:hypothetical protein
MYLVRGAAEISRRPENIQALLKIGKNERRSTVASALKGYFPIFIPLKGRKQILLVLEREAR